MERFDASDYPSAYRRELSAALGAARDAGALLKAAFDAPGGAPGSRGKSPADVESERLIRGRLEPAFPGYGICAEEIRSLNRLPGADGSAVPPGAPRWFVDPDDGTDAFLSGRRGAAVSIGLVVADEPVLGVVYAFAARSGRGDLFYWAEGGPLVRDGVPVDRAAAAAVRPDGAPVLVASGGADTASLPNALASAPARVRAEPSIAYRLALVAAGEADLTFSLHAPNDYDVAGGHALLRGAGCDLYASGGAPIRYGSSAGPEGAWGSVGDCFGGPGEQAAEYARRDWSALKRAAHARHPEYPFVRTDKALAFSADPSLLARASALVVGGVAGSAFEGGMAGQPGRAWESALLLARSLVAAGGYDEAAALRAARWHADAPGPRPPAVDSGEVATARATVLAVYGWRLGEAGLRALAARDAVVTGSLTGADPDAQARVALAARDSLIGDSAEPPEPGTAELSAVLTARALPGFCAVPRPEPLWPVDALRLTERLLVLGDKLAPAP